MKCGTMVLVPALFVNRVCERVRDSREREFVTHVSKFVTRIRESMAVSHECDLFNDSFEHEAWCDGSIHALYVNCVCVREFVTRVRERS